MNQDLLNGNTVGMWIVGMGGPCAVYGSEKPLYEVTSQAEAGDRESYVRSSYASGRQLSDIRMIIAVSSEDPEHLHMPALLGHNAFQKKGTTMDWLHMQANKYTRGRGGLYKQGS